MKSFNSNHSFIGSIHYNTVYIHICTVTTYNENSFWISTREPRRWWFKLVIKQSQRAHAFSPYSTINCVLMAGQNGSATEFHLPVSYIMYASVLYVLVPLFFLFFFFYCFHLTLSPSRTIARPITPLASHRPNTYHPTSLGILLVETYVDTKFLR